MVGSISSEDVSSSPTLVQQKQAWLRAREESRQAQIVTVNQGFSLTPSLYFGTRRCTYSTVVSVVTTVLPLPRYDPLDPPLEKEIAKASDTSRWAEERARETLRRVKQPDDNQTDEPGKKSPYKMTRSLPTQQQHIALVREQRAFMKSLLDARRERARKEHQAALVIQRVRRGFVLRRQFRSIRQKLLVRKRIRGSLLQVTKGTAIVLGEKDRRLKLTTKQNAAARKIQGVYRFRSAKRLLAKLRALNFCEKRQRAASIIQGSWRACIARWLTTKLRLQREHSRRQALARLLCRLFLGFKARCRVRGIRLHREAVAAFRLQSFVRCRLLAAKTLHQARTRQIQERGHDGAARMQSMIRGTLQRARVIKMRRVEEVAVRTACTLMIQRIARGFLGRQKARRRGIETAHERGWKCAMHVNRLVRGFLGRQEASRERILQEADLLVQARRGNVEAVVDLLDGFDATMGAVEPADVTISSVPGGNNVLHLAAKFGHLEVITLVLPRLLKTAPKLVYAPNSKACTPVALAVVNGHERVAIYLLVMTTPLFVDQVLPGRNRTLLHEAARLGLESVVTKLLQLFPHLFTGYERDGWTQRTAIHEALLIGVELVQDGKLFPWTRHHGHTHKKLFANVEEQADHTIAVVDALLAQLPLAVLNAQDFLGFTALHIAAARGNIRIVTHLLELGADVSIKDVHDRTAWRVALLRGHDACFQEIRKKWLQDVVSNKTTSSEASESGGNLSGGNPSTPGTNISRVLVTPGLSTTMTLHPQLECALIAACKADDVAKMRFYVDECEVSVNIVEEINHLLGLASEICAQRPSGRSLLMVACESRQIRAVKFLLARDDLDLNFMTSDGHSALNIAQAQLDERN